MSLDYHRLELAIARDRNNAARVMPPISPMKHRRILDIGCGMGQTLIASDLPPSIEAYGVDCSAAAIEAGQKIIPASVKLVCATGENLPFPESFFDLVFSRVSLPYMKIDRVLRETARVLKPGGDVWFALHPAKTVMRRAEFPRNVKGLARCAYVLLNGALFNAFGKQFSFLGRQETFQTVGGMRRAMKRAGLELISAETTAHFIVVQGTRGQVGP
jgi:ubiquinone/menaquinone biosynthesis C-methylase UbiE